MFTGIVQQCVPIHWLDKKPGLVRFSLLLQGQLAEGVNIGASIAINGVCLTVTEFKPCDSGLEVFFDMMQQTLSLTNTAEFVSGSAVNVERSAQAMQEVGGHIVSGHIDAQAEILTIEHSENNCKMRFQVPQNLSKYLFNKGFVALNGCSLTIADCSAEDGWLDVWFIPETLRATNFGQLSPGAKVNLEVERATQAIVDTVERVLADKNIGSIADISNAGNINNSNS